MMRKLCLFVIWFITSFIYAQSPDETIKVLFEQNNYFELARQYAIMKDNVSPLLQGFSESMLHIAFNKPEKASKSITKLINSYQSEFQNSELILLVQLLASSNEAQHKYREAADIMNSLVAQASQQMDETTLNACQSLSRIYTAMDKEPAIKIVKREKATTVDVIFKEVGFSNQKKSSEQTLMYLPASIGEEIEDFLFDTSSSTNIISHSMAMKHDLRIIADSVFLIGSLGTEWGQIAMVDRLAIGNMILEHVPFYVVKDQSMQSYAQAVIGMSLLKTLGEVQILPEQRKIIFPEKFTSSPNVYSNIMFNNEIPVIEVKSNQENVRLVLETSKPTSFMSYTYYQKHLKDYEKLEEEHELILEEVGGKTILPTKLIPQYPIEINEKTIDIPQLPIIYKPFNTLLYSFDGTMGMDILRKFKKVTINTKEMFITVE